MDEGKRLCGVEVMAASSATRATGHGWPDMSVEEQDVGSAEKEQGQQRRVKEILSNSFNCADPLLNDHMKPPEIAKTRGRLGAVNTRSQRACRRRTRAESG